MMNLISGAIGFALLTTHRFGQTLDVGTIKTTTRLDLTSIPLPQHHVGESNRNASATSPSIGFIADKTESDFHPSYMAHNAPKSTYLIINSPAISNFMLLKGWSQEHSLQTLTNAVNKVVMQNPVLTGKATCPQNWWKDPQIGIEPGVFIPKEYGGEHCFVQTMDASHRHARVVQNGGLKTVSDQLRFIDKYASPLVGPLDTTLQQIQKESPLFEVKVVLLPDDYACLYIKMSHCIGDLVTYYQIVDQIAAADRGDDMKPIDWDNPLKAQHEIFPDDLSERDFQRLYGLPFFVGLASHMPSMFLRKQQYLLLDKDKIRHQKEVYKENGCKGISNNDIITAALCDANRSTDIFAFTKSMRGVTPGLGLRDGGNLHVEIPFQRCAGRNPLVIQDMLDKGRYFERNEVPLWESVMGRVGRISNCCAPMHKMSFGGCKPLCYCPAKSFLDKTPMDLAIIFRVNKDQDAVLHNFWDINENSERLQAILAAEQ